MQPVNQNISLQQTLYQITERWPQTIPVFTSNGFSRLGDPQQRRQFGSALTLETALRIKQLDAKQFISLLETAIARQQSEPGRNSGSVDPAQKLQITGLLPCPVRIPLLDRFNAFLVSRPELQLDYQLQAASMGLQWVEEHLSGAVEFGQWPDLFISAGFDMFFDKKKVGQFREQGAFTDLARFKNCNSSFAGLQIRDPQRFYTVIAAVPAVFLVNLEELGSVPIPRSWPDLFHPQLRGRVSLPVGDFDLFNGILLNIHKKYGDDGVRGLAGSLLEAMHPSQMVKSDRRQQNRPAVTIMPYFFSRMVKENGPLKLVWPEDGAIISPIFLLAKKSKAEQLQPVVDFFTSRDVARVLAHDGLFPSLHPDVDNRLPEGAAFQWLGWDYLIEHDISDLIASCETVFNDVLDSNREVVL